MIGWRSEQTIECGKYRCEMVRSARAIVWPVLTRFCLAVGCWVLCTGSVSSFCGSGKLGFVKGTADATAFTSNPFSVCVDPFLPGVCCIVDQSSVRRFDAGSDQVTAVAGSESVGFADGIGSDAKFRDPTAVIAGPNTPPAGGKANAVSGSGSGVGSVLYLADIDNNRLRGIDTCTQRLITLP